MPNYGLLKDYRDLDGTNWMKDFIAIFVSVNKMKVNKLITPPNDSPTKPPALNMIIAITALILFGSGYCFSQTPKTGQTIDTYNNIQTKNAADVYLDKNDTIFISIKRRAVTDLKKSADPESPENKLLGTQINTWTKEKQDQFEALFVKTINNYNAQTHFEPGTFMLVFEDLGKMDQKEIAEEYDIRVLYLGKDKYVAEFWEDGLAVNSEAHAIARAHELANSERAKKNPGSGLGDVEVIKENYSNNRKSINNGQKERYTKVMALLYTLDKDGSIIFHNPFQPLIDFK